ncbi:hypothetical protein HCN44_005929 [Aphidius gifuensis]|uniref:Uncharacterized protein n=1 Tax=Aphidius gifuensis TaxID=684658 RepID=A0A834XTG4_APHGI|nr:hypothetical protein HCN44_005929 [Aphidius gifuensis]
MIAGTWFLYNGLNDSTSEKYQNLNSSNNNSLDYCREFNKCGLNATCTLNETAKNYSCYTHDSVISQNASFDFNKTYYTKENFLMFTCSSMSELIEGSWTFKVPNLSVDNITTMSYNGTDKKIYMENLTDNEITDPTFAIDWISRNIFWVNHNLNTIFVASLDNSSMKLSLINNISNAKYICVHPSRGKIYWLNNCGKSCQIETANEDGSNRSIFLSGSQVQQAASLIIDITSDKLCWIGGKNILQFKIIFPECANIEKKSITIIADVDSWSTIAVSHDTYYWTKNRRQIYYMNKKKSSKSRLLIDMRKKPVKIRESFIHNLVFIPGNIPPVTNLCQRENGGCSFNELCLPKGQHGVTCRKT